MRSLVSRLDLELTSVQVLCLHELPWNTTQTNNVVWGSYIHNVHFRLGGEVCRKFWESSRGIGMWLLALKTKQSILSFLAPLSSSLGQGCCWIIILGRALQWDALAFTFMHLADTFIQSDLHCIQVTVSTFYQLLLSLGIEPMILALLAPCSTSWATGKLLLASSPILQTLIINYYTRTLPLPPSLASVALNRQPDGRVCGQRREWLRVRTAACWSWITSPVAKCVYGLCAFAEVFFLFSHCTPQGA